jgi:hypothetical protein
MLLIYPDDLIQNILGLFALLEPLKYEDVQPKI